MSLEQVLPGRLSQRERWPAERALACRSVSVPLV
ncbi:hypothetical protein FHS89_002045 [Rubricella aquisinus]|uniref:Uncharacterized protein n=1 Tax=Rubricella aquisinus TaxID=2028108 RepID=A0A840X2C3_9RHOB|nr:hypothetical protein [Rubricella aquisinus]